MLKKQVKNNLKNKEDYKNKSKNVKQQVKNKDQKRLKKQIQEDDFRYIKNLIYPEFADNMCRVPNVFPVPTTVVNWRTNYSHTVAAHGDNVIVLDPFERLPLKYFNPTTETD